MPLGGPTNAVSSLQTAPTLTDDELTLVFSRMVGQFESSLLIATRGSVDEDFGAPSEIDVGHTNRSFQPTMTGDGLVLFWSEYEAVDATVVKRARILTARRTSVGQPFGSPGPYREGAETETLAFSPHVSHDGVELFFSLTEDPKNLHIYRSQRGYLGAYEAPTKVTELAAVDTFDGGLALTNDGLTIFFSSNRPGSVGISDIFTAQRASRVSPFGEVTRVEELESADGDRPGWVSPDGCRLYMARGNDVATVSRLYVASRPP